MLAIRQILEQNNLNPTFTEEPILLPFERQ